MAGLDGVRGFVQLAAGLTEMTVNRATGVASSLVHLGSSNLPPQVSGAVASLAEELVTTAQNNRDSLAKLIRTEVGEAVEAVSVRPELDAIRDALTAAVHEIEDLRQQLLGTAAGRIASERLGLLETSLHTARSAAERLGLIDSGEDTTPEADPSVYAAKDAADRLGLTDEEFSDSAVKKAADETRGETPRLIGVRRPTPPPSAEVEPALRKLAPKKTAKKATPATMVQKAVVKKAAAKKTATKRAAKKTAAPHHLDDLS